MVGFHNSLQRFPIKRFIYTLEAITFMPTSMAESSAKGTSLVSSSHSRIAKLHISAARVLISSGRLCSAVTTHSHIPRKVAKEMMRFKFTLTWIISFLLRSFFCKDFGISIFKIVLVNYSTLFVQINRVVFV